MIVDKAHGQEYFTSVMGIPQIIEGLRQRYGSVNAAARAMGMPEATLHRLHTGERDNPTLETLRRIADGLDVPLSTLIEQMDGKGPTNLTRE